MPPIAPEGKKRTAGVLSLYDCWGALSSRGSPEHPSIPGCPGLCHVLSYSVLTVALSGADVILALSKRKPRLRKTVNIFKLRHQPPSLKLVFLLLGILPACREAGRDVRGRARWGGQLEDSVCKCSPRGALGEEWVGWGGGELPRERGGWRNREGGPVQPRGALRVRVAPIILGPRKTQLPVMWESGGAVTPWIYLGQLVSFLGL